MSESFPVGSKVLVIGASGFVGTALRRALVRQGAKVHCFSRSKPANAADEGIFEWTIGDISDENALARITKGQEWVFHLAHTSLPAESNANPVKEVVENVCGSLKILEACVRAGVRKVVFASSGGTVYGACDAMPIYEDVVTNPLAAYGISKLSVEKYLFLFRHLYGLDYHILRIANPFGPSQSPFKAQGLIAKIIHRGLTRTPIEVFGDGRIIRDYVFIDDVVKALLAVMCYDGKRKLMNVGTGEGRSIIDVLSAIEHALGSTRLVVDRLDQRRVDVPSNILDIRLIRRELGWQPGVSFEEGVDRTVAWMRAEYAQANAFSD